MKLILPLILVFVALLWAATAYFIKKDVKLAKQIIGYISFFVIIWTGLYFLIFYN